jgi:hypothetical protein
MTKDGGKGKAGGVTGVNPAAARRHAPSMPERPLVEARIASPAATRDLFDTSLPSAKAALALGRS